MYNVYQHWDPLKVCIVGRSYPPEFYSWIKKSSVRNLFEKIAIETEEDYQQIIKKLESFGVQILRPKLPNQTFVNGKFVPPPMTPRDYTLMAGEDFYISYGWVRVSFDRFYNDVKDPSWPECNSLDEFRYLPQSIRDECIQIHNMHNYIGDHPFEDFGCFDKIKDIVRNQGNNIFSGYNENINGAMCARIGKDLFFGTENYLQNVEQLKNQINQNFVNTRNHIVNTGGHSDATYCPVCPGLIISLNDVPTYTNTFPGWEVVYLPGQSWEAVSSFLKLKEKNKGKWWIPGFEQDQDVVDTVERWLGHWTGYVEETVFDVNMLIIDPKMSWCLTIISKCLTH